MAQLYKTIYYIYLCMCVYTVNVMYYTIDDYFLINHQQKPMRIIIFLWQNEMDFRKIIFVKTNIAWNVYSPLLPLQA